LVTEISGGVDGLAGVMNGGALGRKCEGEKEKGAFAHDWTELMILRTEKRAWGGIPK